MILSDTNKRRRRSVTYMFEICNKMEKTIQIFCKNTGTYVDVAGGETLLEIYGRVKDEVGIRPICAHVNNKTERLTYPVFMPKMVEFLDEKSPSGQRMYVRSLCMVLAKAVHDVFPERKLKMEHSISKGYYCSLPGGAELRPEDVGRLKSRMREIVEAANPFKRYMKLTADVIKEFEKAGMDDKVRLLRSTSELYTVYYRLDDIIDSYYGDLVPDTSYLRVFDLVKYKGGMLLLPPDFSGGTNVPAEMIPQAKMYEAFTEYIRFNQIVGVGDVGVLNEVVERGDVDMLINVAETLHDKKIGGIAAQIAERYHEGGARVVLLAGPSSSGKTTTTKRLSIHLLANLIRPQMISLDNYFVDRHLTPRDSNGDYDYESLYALDIDKFNEDLNDLIAGKEVKMPTYDFATGKRIYKGDTLKLTDNTILLMEGIHGLNPELTRSIPDKQKFKVYVSALTTLTIDDHNWVPTTDNRLLRRIVRDAKYRGISAVDTIARWQSVRRGEEKWIFPYQENADAMFNSSLLFELGVMKDYAEPLLKKVPHNVPEYAEAYRLLCFLSYFREIGDRQVPSTSLLREFLGGSSFKY